jgi:origin recognition complex subunit 1
MQKLDNFFKKREYIENKKKLEQKNPMDSHIILVVDEIDFLINKTQSLLYNLFNWTTYDYSKLIVITISNTLDFPDHLLPKIKSRMGNNKLMFKPYNKEELMDIIKFKGIDYDKYSDDAIKLCCMKVSAINGDLRRTFQILLRAKELFSLENTRKSKYKKIDKNYIIQASEDLFNSKLRKVMESLQICEKIVICAILSKIKDENENKVKVGNIYDRLDIFFEKYNASNKTKVELYWEEFKTIIYNLIRLQIINFCDSQKLNFMENSITIKFYVEEFVIACDKDENLKPVLNYLTNFISA